ncbi:MAG: hypothetical protein K2Z81_03425 [Cyanobacteria bacterium]|nr:hypothetical protein [Cyanobacteriota bacterium]
MDAINRTGTRFEECADAFTTSMIDAGIQRPLNGLSQLVNHFAGREIFGDLELVNPPLDYEQGSAEWYSQQAGTGLGVAFDFLLARRAAGSANGLRGSIAAEGAMVTRPGFLKTAGRGFLTGATYEGLFRPIHQDEMHQFWQARLRNAFVGGVTMATLSGAERALSGLASTHPMLSSQMLTNRSLAAQVVRDTSVRMVSGTAAGVANVETFSLIANGELTDLNTAAHFGAKYMLTAGFVPSNRFLLDPLDKTGLNLSKERDALMESANANGVSDRVAPLLTVFESRAANDGLSRQETARTIRNVTRFLEQRDDAAIPADLRNELAVEGLFNATYPSDVNQGANLTCTTAAMEGRLYRVSPSDPIRVAANLAVNGKFRTHNGTEVRLQPDQLKPDWEAMRFCPSVSAVDGERPFISQLFQLGTVNAHWSRHPFLADSGLVPAGSLEYRTERTGIGLYEPVHVERLIDARTQTELRVGGEIVNQPMLGVSDMLDLERQISGRYSPDRIVTFNPGQVRDSAVVRTRTPEQLIQALTELRENNRFPVNVTVDRRQPLVARSAVAPTVMTSLRETNGHMMQILDFDPATGDVYVDGTWGASEDMLGRPDTRKPISLSELWQSMQDGSNLVRELNLSGNRDFLNSAMSTVQNWPNLTRANFSCSNLNDEGITHLRHCPELTQLNMDHTAITDAGLRTVATRLPKIQRLSLAGTNITDAAVDDILRMENLTELNIQNTKISHFAAQRLIRHSRIRLSEQR